MRPTFWARAGAIHALLAVLAGAFGAHALRPRIGPERLAVFETGARYHFYHSIALFVVAWLASRGARRARHAGWAFQCGIVLFSGSLYVLAMSGVKAFGAITPFGGAAFLAGWVLVALSAKSLDRAGES